MTSRPDVRVDGLAEQHDLAVARVGELADLAQHLARRRATLAAARERHHAERAELVAAALDRDEPGDAVAAGRAGQALVGLGLVELEVDDRLRVLGARGGEQLGHPAIAIGAGDHVDGGRALGEAFLEVLGHAADDREHGARPPALERTELGGARDHALLGLLAHRAGVDDDDVGVVGAVAGA